MDASIKWVFKAKENYMKYRIYLKEKTIKQLMGESNNCFPNIMPHKAIWIPKIVYHKMIYYCTANFKHLFPQTLRHNQMSSFHPKYFSSIYTWLWYKLSNSYKITNMILIKLMVIFYTVSITDINRRHHTMPLPI